MAAYREQELMLGGGEAFALSLLLAPVEKSPQFGAELEQPLVVGIG